MPLDIFSGLLQVVETIWLQAEGAYMRNILFFGGGSVPLQTSTYQSTSIVLTNLPTISKRLIDYSRFYRLGASLYDLLDRDEIRGGIILMYGNKSPGDNC